MFGFSYLSSPIIVGFVWLLSVRYFSQNSSTALSGCTSFSKRYSRDNALATLPTTSERLGAGGGDDTVHAGHKRSYSHCSFRGATPPLAPNRQLAEVLFVFIVEMLTNMINIKLTCLFLFSILVNY